MKKKDLVFCWVLLIALISTSLWSRAPKQGPAGQTTPPPENKPPRIRATTRLVQVDVIAEDKRGNPVANLTREEFTLTDKGQAQEIRYFSLEAVRDLEVASAPLPPNIFSNRRVQNGNLPSSITVILIDTLNARAQDQVYVRDQVEKFLGELRPEDRVALYVLRNNLHILHEFTNNADSLLRALASFRGETPRELQQTLLSAGELAPGIREVVAYFSNTYEQEKEFYTMNRVQKTAVALEAIANHLAPIPGRKNLIWLSDGFPIALAFDPGSPDPGRLRIQFQDEIERVARAMNSANLAIYPVQATGLSTRGDVSAQGLPHIRREGEIAIGPGQSTINEMQFPESAQLTMKLMAERTGGTAYYNTNDLGNAIRRAIDDSRVSYLLGYYPAHNDWKGNFREIKVSVKRPDIRLRYRKGYLAVPDKPLDDKQRRDLLQQYSWSPLDASAIGLTVEAARTRTAGTDSIKLNVQADPHDVEFDQEGADWLGTLDLYFLQKGADGKPLKDDFRTLNMKLGEERYRAVALRGVDLVKNIDVVPGAVQIRVLIRDNRSGKMGSLTIPLEEKAAKAPG